MAEMWDGCATCHHNEPSATTQPASQPGGAATPTDAPPQVTACKSCHPIAAADGDLHRPTLKGAYHRQCLNCHREWTGENACVMCHLPAGVDGAAHVAPTRDDIVGRMHPPIAAPDTHLYRVRFTPVAGPNVLFRHRQHAERFGIRCATCHRRDNCADCHARAAETVSPIRPGRTWSQSHAPCTTCHVEQACDRCHFRDDAPPPPAFAHQNTGQMLEDRHADLACADCHADLRAIRQISCGDAGCHGGRAMSFPTDRPGARIETAPPPAIEIAAPTQPPSTRPVLVRIRRGGT